MVGAGQGQGCEERRDLTVHPPLRRNSSEHVAAKAKITDRALNDPKRTPSRNPGKAGTSRMEIAAAPRGGAVVARLRGGRAPRDLHPRPIDLEIHYGELARSRQQRERQDHPARRRARADPPATPASVSAPASWSVSSTRPGPRSPGPSRCSRFESRAASCRTRSARRYSPEFRLGAEHVDALRRSSLSPGERTRASSRSSRPAASTASCSTSRPTTPDLPAIEHLEQALRAFAGTLLLVTHDRQLLDAVTLTRHVEVADGRLPGITYWHRTIAAAVAMFNESTDSLIRDADLHVGGVEPRS